MLAIELVRVMLGFGALISGIIGACIVFDPTADKPAPEKGNFLLLIAIIALLIMFHI